MANKKYEFAVEVTSYEAQALWREANAYGIPWKPSTGGYLTTIGSIEDKPIVLSINIHTIDSHEVVFCEITGSVADYNKIREWVCDALLTEGGMYVHPERFHSIINRIREIGTRQQALEMAKGMEKR